MLLTCTKLPHVLKTFVLSIFEWPLKIGFTAPIIYFQADSSIYVSNDGIFRSDEILVLWSNVADRKRTV